MNKIIISTPESYLQEEKIMPLNLSSYDVLIDEHTTYQKLLGFGGGLTDATLEVMEQMDKPLQEEFIEKVFSSSYLNYSLLRLPIGSCDFSSSSYDYLNNGYDYLIKHVLPFLQRVSQKKKITLFASCWSPPYQYKTNGEYAHGGKLQKEHYDDFVTYLLNYLLYMKQNHFPITYLNVQNEPQATQVWESCIYDEQEEMTLINKLFPLIKEHQLETKLLIWDHNRDIILPRVEKSLSYLDDINYIDGVSYHWYDQNCSTNLSLVHEKYPSLKLYFTEGCIELLNLDQNNPSSHIGHFTNGLVYVRNYLKDLENYSTCFIDWNLLLNEKGGPNHVGNFCEAPIMYHREKKCLIYNPSFYLIQHFSRYLSEGDIRIKTLNSFEDILISAFKKPNGQIIVIIFSQNSQKDLKIKVKEQIFLLNLQKNCIITLVVD